MVSWHVHSNKQQCTYPLDAESAINQSTYVEMFTANIQKPTPNRHTTTFLSINQVYSVSQKNPPPRGVLTFFIFFTNGWEFLIDFLHTYSTFLCMLDYKFLFNYPRFWRSYAILSATIQFTLYAQNVKNRPKRVRWYIYVSRW